MHRHLDWEPTPADWLRDGKNTIALAWHNNILKGVIAFAPPQSGTTWLRLLALPNNDQREIFHQLWMHIQNLLQPEVTLLAAMSTQFWIAPLLEEAGFAQRDMVINLVRPTQPLPGMRLADVNIRGLRLGEFPRVLAVDNTAFQPIWQMREKDLRAAGQRASYYKIAHNHEKVVGYQLSMRYGTSMHLARLATLPECQNQRIGSTLLYDLVKYSEAQGIKTVTVNTQISNTSSQALYYRADFERNNHDIPVYMLEL